MGFLGGLREALREPRHHRTHPPPSYCITPNAKRMSTLGASRQRQQRVRFLQAAILTIISLLATATGLDVEQDNALYAVMRQSPGVIEGGDEDGLSAELSKELDTVSMVQMGMSGVQDAIDAENAAEQIKEYELVATQKATEVDNSATKTADAATSAEETATKVTEAAHKAEDEAAKTQELFQEIERIRDMPDADVEAASSGADLAAETTAPPVA